MDENRQSGSIFDWLSGAAVFAFVVFFGWFVIVPNLVRTKCTLSTRSQCINNLRQIDGAKEQWTVETHKSTNDIPQIEDVAGYLKNSVFPKCPERGIYTIGRVDEDPKCSIPGHKLE